MNRKTTTIVTSTKGQMYWNFFLKIWIKTEKTCSVELHIL